MDDGQGSVVQFQKRSFNFKIVCMQFQYEKPHARTNQSVTESGSESVGRAMSPPDSCLRTTDCGLRTSEYGIRNTEYGLWSWAANESCMQICRNGYFPTPLRQRIQRNCSWNRCLPDILEMSSELGRVESAPLI